MSRYHWKFFLSLPMNNWYLKHECTDATNKQTIAHLLTSLMLRLPCPDGSCAMPATLDNLSPTSETNDLFILLQHHVTCWYYHELWKWKSVGGSSLDLFKMYSPAIWLEGLRKTMATLGWWTLMKLRFKYGTSWPKVIHLLNFLRENKI
jgi:hypothetical protein